MQHAWERSAITVLVGNSGGKKPLGRNMHEEKE
jgi:hypothetical protein